jgi:hypothetical protein
MGTPRANPGQEYDGLMKSDEKPDEQQAITDKVVKARLRQVRLGEGHGSMDGFWGD